MVYKVHVDLDGSATHLLEDVCGESAADDCVELFLRFNRTELQRILNNFYQYGLDVCRHSSRAAKVQLDMSLLSHFVQQAQANNSLSHQHARLR